MEKGRGKGTDTLQTDNGFTRKEYIEREAAIAFMNEVEPCICHDPDGAVFTATTVFCTRDEAEAALKNSTEKEN